MSHYENINDQCCHLTNYYAGKYLYEIQENTNRIPEDINKEFSLEI